MTEIELDACSACGEAVQPKDRCEAKNIVFHSDCFKCTTCGRNIATVVHGHHEGNFYCQVDYVKLFGKICVKCKKAIKGAFVETAGRAWCADHFTCDQCRKPITGDTHRVHEKVPYCEECFSKITQHNCRKCKAVIPHGEMVQSLGFYFHVGCFVCAIGDHKIGDRARYYEHDGKTYCKKHWDENNISDWCQACKKYIENDYVKVMGKCFHSKCWKCSECKFVIRTKQAVQNGDNFYCQPCAAKKQKEKEDAEEKARWDAVIAKYLLRGYGDLEPAPGTIPPSESKCYPYATLILRPPAIPKEIDFRQREQYLEKWEFKKVFGVEMDEFNQYPMWKRLMMKKEVGLF